MLCNVEGGVTIESGCSGDRWKWMTALQFHSSRELRGGGREIRRIEKVARYWVFHFCSLFFFFLREIFELISHSHLPLLNKNKNFRSAPSISPGAISHPEVSIIALCRAKS